MDNCSDENSDGVINVFSKQWFLKHQKRLLRFANTGFGRYILRIHGKRSGVGKNKILRIEPNAIWWKGENYKENQFTAEFRTNDKFACRLYFAFKPFWWTLHFIDWLVLERYEWAKKWDFGFATLVRYPGSLGANNPCDGRVARDGVNETFANIRSGAGTSVDNTNQTLNVSLDATNTSNQYSVLSRVIICYDTSSLGAGATISAAVASFYKWHVGANGLGGSPSFDIVAATPANTNALVAADFTQLGSTSFANLAYGSIIFGQYNDWTLDSNGIANISKTGISKFGIRNNWDTINTFGGTWSNFAATTLNVRSAEQTGTSEDPYITITYSTSTAYNQSCDESITLVDTKNTSLARVFGEAIAFIDTLDILRAKSFSETVALVDTKNLTLARSFAEIIALADTKTLLIIKAFLEAITLVDTKSVTMGKAFLESLSLVDTIDLLPEKILMEVLTLIDIKGAEIGKRLLESIILVDNFTKTFGISLFETITLSPILKAIINGLVGGIWTKQAKSSASYTKQPKASATFTPQPKSDDPAWTPDNYI